MTSGVGPGRPPAVLFDVDGTLVDSNYLHVHAWYRAFIDVGLVVESWRIHRCIGMDGSSLLSELAGDADDDTRERANDLQSRYYKETTSLLRPLPGALELLKKVEALGLQVVLATSAPEDELAILRSVLQSDDVVSVVTSSEDVDTAKPEPGIVEVALDRAGVGAGSAVFVGDSTWDAIACRRAGVTTIGVLSGGVPGTELENAGAQSIFADAQDLCEHLDATPIAVLAHARRAD